MVTPFRTLGYKDNFRPDIAILEFDNPFNSNVVPVCLPTNLPRPEDSLCLSTGWSNSWPPSANGNERKQNISYGW